MRNYYIKMSNWNYEQSNLMKMSNCCFMKGFMDSVLYMVKCVLICGDWNYY
jgi:hypothetical protein